MLKLSDAKNEDCFYYIHYENIHYMYYNGQNTTICSDKSEVFVVKESPRVILNRINKMLGSSESD